MKKKGITLTEILVAITIFSLGIVPLMLSLNSSFEATVFNRDYTKAMEYNVQLMEEIGTLTPTELGKSQYTGLLGSGSLEEDVRKMLEARSEDRASEKGIYKMVDWKDGRFDFNAARIDSHKIYRHIEVGDPIGSDDIGLVVLPVDIHSRYTSDDEDIVVTSMVINLELSDTEKIHEGIIDDGRIQVKKGQEVRAPESGSIASGNTELAKHIKLIVVGVGNGANDHKVDEADIEINENGVKYRMSKEAPDIFSKNIDIKPGDRLTFYLRANGGTANVDLLRYQLYRDTQ